MVLHAAYNSIATLILITTTFLPYQSATAILFTFILVGILGVAGTILSFWVLWNSTNPQKLPQPEKPTRLGQWAWIIPLILLTLIYTYGSLSEVIAAKFPQLLVNEDLVFTPQPAWQEPQSWQYDIQDVLGTKLGTAECKIQSVGELYQLNCQGQNKTSSLMDRIPWEFPWLNRKFKIAAADWEREVLWRKNLQITQFHEFQSQLNRSFRKEEDSQTLVVEFEDKSVNKLDIPSNALIFGEWPWRLPGLPFDLFYGGAIPLVALNEAGNIDLFDAFVTVRSAEPTWTPAGSIITWKVTLTYTDNSGNKITESAWYETKPPHNLIRYDNGQLNYVLNSE
jgi:hypothetical protein